MWRSDMSVSDVVATFAYGFLGSFIFVCILIGH